MILGYNNVCPCSPSGHKKSDILRGIPRIVSVAIFHNRATANPMAHHVRIPAERVPDRMKKTLLS